MPRSAPNLASRHGPLLPLARSTPALDTAPGCAPGCRRSWRASPSTVPGVEKKEALTPLNPLSLPPFPSPADLAATVRAGFETARDSPAAAAGDAATARHVLADGRLQLKRLEEMLGMQR